MRRRRGVWFISSYSLLFVFVETFSRHLWQG